METLFIPTASAPVTSLAEKQSVVTYNWSNYPTAADSN